MAWIQVSNLSPHTTEQDLSSLFSFCGSISQITIESSKIALIFFNEPDSVITALLLDETLLQGAPIHVEEFKGSVPSQEDQNSCLPQIPLQSTLEQLSTGSQTLAITEMSSNNEEAPQQTSSRVEALAAIVAAGYTLGQDALQNAKEFDQAHLQVGPAVEKQLNTLRSAAQQIDEEFQIQNKLTFELEKIQASESYQDASKKLQEFDSKYQITDRITNFFSSAVAEVQQFETVTKREIAMLEKKKEEELFLSSQPIEPPKQICDTPQETDTPQQTSQEETPSGFTTFVEDSVQAIQNEYFLRSTDPNSSFFSFLNALTPPDTIPEQPQPEKVEGEPKTGFFSLF